MLRESSGILRVVGESNVSVAAVGKNAISTYTFFEIGDKVLRDIKVFSGLNGMLREQVGKDVTMYFNGRFLVGLRTQEGRCYAMHGGSLTGNWILLGLCLALGLPLAIILIGLPLLVYAAMTVWPIISAQLAARSIPNAILI